MQERALLAARASDRLAHAWVQSSVRLSEIIGRVTEKPVQYALHLNEELQTSP
jgi:hypothetical protein